MNYIIGDIGNTSTRICLLNKSKIMKSVIFDTKRIFLNNFVRKIFNKFLNKKLKKKYYFQVSFLWHLKKIKKDFKNSNFKIFEIKSFKLKKLIKINIKNINQLGSDRIVNSIEGKNLKIV